jgi:hypothetical protein
MKQTILLSFLILFSSFLCFSQNIQLNPINYPGQESVSVTNGIILEKNIVGPKRILFLGNQMCLERKEVKNGYKSGESVGVDKLTTFYSGRIFSPGIMEPFVFENKSAEELNSLEIVVFPKFLNKPYTLYLNLTIRASSKSILSKESDDAGIYHARILIDLVKP